MTAEWKPCDPKDVRPGDRIAPLSSWTLDVIRVRDDGVWEVFNHDTNSVFAYNWAVSPPPDLHCLDKNSLTEECRAWLNEQQRNQLQKARNR